MTLTHISKEQCIQKLQDYANTEVYSWNPFTWFRKIKLDNHTVASEIATLLEQDMLSDDALLKIAEAIDGFDDSELQHDLLCFLYSNINEDSKSFLAKRENIVQIRQTLDNLVAKQYRPWWTLFLIELPYYSELFRSNLTWFITTISHLFTDRREEIKQALINTYSSDESTHQLISEYNRLDNADSDKKDELNNILKISFQQTAEHSQRAVLKAIKNALKEVSFGQVFMSAAGVSAVIGSYLANEENKTKSPEEQAQEILQTIAKGVVKVGATQLVKSAVPGVTEAVEAVVSVAISASAQNPLDTDRKIVRGFASVAGGAIGGAIGSVVPVVGTTVGAYVGAVLSKTATTRFYQSLEAWQTAPKGPQSIIPRYYRSLLAFIDSDAANILEPMYIRYLETEEESKKLGDEIAARLSVYQSLLKNSSGPISDEYLEIIDEEMQRLRLEFTTLKNSHGTVVQSLYQKQPDNLARVRDYTAKVKECLEPLHKPINGMLNAYFSPLVSESYAEILTELPVVNGASTAVTNSEMEPCDVLDDTRLAGDQYLDECENSSVFALR